MTTEKLILTSEFYHTLINASFGVATVLYLLMLYLIFKKSTGLEKYRLYILNNVTWAYVLQALIFVAKPKFLFPKLLIYFDGMVQNCQPIVIYGICYGILITSVNIICGILITLGFRYRQLLPFSGASIGRKRKVFGFVVIVMHVIGLIGIIFPGMAITTDRKIILSVITKPDNFSSPFVSYEPYLNISSMFALDTPLFQCTLYLTYILAIAYTIIMGLAYIHMKFMVNSSANRVFYFTYHLQNMLVNAYAAETLATLIFIILPLLIGLYCTERQMFYSSLICEALVIVVSFYPIVLFLIIIMFIKPYQRWIMKIARSMVSKLPDSWQKLFTEDKMEVELQQHLETQLCPKSLPLPLICCSTQEGYI